MKNVRCVGYARCGALPWTNGRRTPLETQADAIREAVARRSAEGKRLQLVGILCEGGRSAADRGRPELEKLLQRVRRREVDAIIVTHIDRLTRSVEHLGDLLREFDRRQVGLISLGDGIDTTTARGKAKLDAIRDLSQGLGGVSS